MCERTFYILAGVLMSICLVQGYKVSFINPCKAEDSKCIKENIAAAVPIYAKGIPELNIESLDPMILKKIDASRPGLKFVITDATVVGLRDCIPKKASRDAGKGKLFVKIQCNGTLDGQYEMNGKLLILPIEGKGAVHAVLRKLVINAEIDLVEKDGKDGKKHWDITQSKHTFDLKDKADVVFENLFNGNEVLGRAARDLISSNGRDIVLEIGPPVVKALFDNLVHSVRDFFSAIPSEELTLDV